MRAEVDSAKASLDAAEALDSRNKSLFDEGASHARSGGDPCRNPVGAGEAESGAGSGGGGRRARHRQPHRDPQPDCRRGDAHRGRPGAVLDDGMVIATVADASNTELIFDAPPATVGLITPGARIAAQWTGGQTVEAEVTGVAPGTTGAWATVRARAIGVAPPIGAVVSGRLVGGAGSVLTVPSNAVQTIEGVTSIFVAEAEGFRAVPIVVGRASNGRTEIVSGLKGAEQIAGEGAFLLKAELGKGTAEHDH